MSRPIPHRALVLTAAPAIGCAALVLVLLFGRPSPAHDPRLDLPDPRSTAEAWNVIESCTRNIGELLKTGQLSEVAYQVADCSPAFRLLTSKPAESRDGAKVQRLTDQLFKSGTALILATREPRDSAPKSSRRQYEQWSSGVKELESLYPPTVVSAAVYVCPMHPKDTHIDPKDRCTVCGMETIRRHIPASSVYESPGQPSLRMTLTADAPLMPGAAAHVLMRLTKSDGSPVRESDLVETHTRKIHLLINNYGLSDYHHVHPEPTQTPGEYAFTFTPARAGVYRAWADVVPAATSIQEYVIADVLPTSCGTPTPIADRASRLTSTASGLHFAIDLNNSGRPPRVGEVVIGEVTVTDAWGQPFKKLEPVMGAFAHIVGFAEDRHTVLHIHPVGVDPTRPDSRGGPTFRFKLYPPTKGFMRLYVQVRVNGQDVFAPFNLNVE